MTKILQTGLPTTGAVRVTVVASFAGRGMEIFVGEVAVFDESHDQQPGIDKRFYEFISHCYILLIVRP